MMTRKDYERAAEIVRSNYNASDSHLESHVKGVMINAFVDFFRADNPRFDADRFREACKPSDKPRKVSKWTP